jgi:hypothetical protein
MKHRSIAMREGEGAMRRQIALLGIVGFFGSVGAAFAQTPSAAPGAFDGTYRFVSSARVNKTYVTRGSGGGYRPFEISVSGNVDGAGTATGTPEK